VRLSSTIRRRQTWRKEGPPPQEVGKAATGVCDHVLSPTMWQTHMTEGCSKLRLHKELKRCYCALFTVLPTQSRISSFEACAWIHRKDSNLVMKKKVCSASFASKRGQCFLVWTKDSCWFLDRLKGGGLNSYAFHGGHPALGCRVEYIVSARLCLLRLMPAYQLQFSLHAGPPRH
jgi:hypothetical protein